SRRRFPTVCSLRGNARRPPRPRGPTRRTDHPTDVGCGCSRSRCLGSRHGSAARRAKPSQRRYVTMPQPDARAIRAFLARAGRRLMVLSSLEGAAAGLAIAAGLIVVGWSAPLALGASVIASLALVLFGVAVATTLSRGRRA